MGLVGGEERFEALFDAQFDRCARLALRIVHDEGTAEELAAEAFARAWSRWGRLGRDPRVEGWVLRVTANLAIDTTRRRRRTPEPVAAAPHDEAVALHLALVHALQGLPRRQREVIALRYLADLSEADVGAVLGVSAGSVKTHLHRGLARLRDRLGTEDDLEVRLAPGP